MKKLPCPICTNAKGRRDCLLHNKQLICSRCCAELRNADTCHECPHFSEAEKHTIEKIKKGGSAEFLLKINPEVEEQVDKALSLLDQGNHETARQSMSSILSENPDNYLAHYGMGCVHAQNDEINKAFDHFKISVDIFPYFSEGWHNMGAACQKLGNFPLALVCARKVLLYGHPEDQEHAFNKQFIGFMTESAAEDGLTLDQYIENGFLFFDAFDSMERGNYETAKAGFLKVLSIDKNHIQSHGNLGLCYAFLGEKSLSIEHFDKALVIDPDYEVVIMNKARVSALAEGEKLSGKALSLDHYSELVEQQQNQEN
jgi:Tfp pilus assembly protein PilF